VRIFRTVLLVDDDPFQAFARCAALERMFFKVSRAASAPEAFIRLEETAFKSSLALVVAGLNLPGDAGPAFVRELNNRLPDTSILALGEAGEAASDYPGKNVRFLPQQASPSEILAAALSMLARARARVA
jgi:CheY-like chemotaxis protein